MPKSKWRGAEPKFIWYVKGGHIVDYTTDFKMATFLAGGDLYCTEFCADSESGLHFDLGGRISELRGFSFLVLRR